MSEPLNQAAQPSAILSLLERPITTADLDSAAALASLPAQSRGARTRGLLLFRLGEETAAVPAATLRRITRHARPRPIPRLSANVFRGLCNIRGELVLCADLHRLLGLPDRESKAPPTGDASDSRRMVVIGGAEDSWVFEVDAVIGIERIDPTEVLPAPVTVAYALGTYTAGIVEIEGKPVTVLDGERILKGFRAGLP